MIADADLGRSELAAIQGGAEALSRIEHIERTWGKRLSFDRSKRPPDRDASLDADVIFAGGGLWLALAPYLAARGARVIVLERGVAGRGHREWNISERELPPLWLSGLFTREEVERFVVARYRHGVCRWHEGGAYPVRDVLDHAIDGDAFLSALRERAERAGVRLLDHHEVIGLASGAHGARVTARGKEGTTELTCRVVVDALGSSSPHARVDLACPTVGGALEGLITGDAPDEVDADVGDVLVTVDHRESGRQHIWEGFPAKGALTTYLFHYARADSLGQTPLLSLYGRFFRTRARYKRGDARIRKLTYGIIPGWSRLGPAPAPPDDAILLVGDAAARHSPLTFCGFGSMVRSFRTIGDGLLRALDERDLSRERLSALAPEPPVLRGVGALAMLLAEPRSDADPAATNRLLDAAFRALSESGQTAYASLLRDEMSPRDFAKFLRITSQRRPEVYRDVLRYLTPRELARWGASVARGFLAGR